MLRFSIRTVLLFFLLSILSVTIWLLKLKGTAIKNTQVSLLKGKEGILQNHPNTYEFKISTYESLVIVIFLEGDVDKDSFEKVRALIGVSIICLICIKSFQRFRAQNNSGPLFYLITWKALPFQFMEEISFWNRVIFKNANLFLGTVLEAESNPVDPRVSMDLVRKLILDQVVRIEGKALWIDTNYIFDPRPTELKYALQSQKALTILESYQKCREMGTQIARVLLEVGALIGTDWEKKVVMEGYHKGHLAYERTLRKELDCFLGKNVPDCYQTEVPIHVKPANLGIVKAAAGLVTPSCQLDIRAEPVFNNIIYAEADGDPQPEHIKARLLDKNKKVLAFGLPTTAKGMIAGSEHVFVRALLPSILKTVSEEEFLRFNVIVYVGFDHGDSVWDKPEIRAILRQKAQKIIGDKPIAVRFYRLPNTHRVAMLWSILFVKAMKDGADYFYQVNDDLTLVTPGWLTNFTTTLDSRGGFGVVGPSDEFNELKCQVLTMSMVTRVHYDIFGTYYPVEMKDWKTDRWLTWVYGKEGTNCWKDMVANNGAAKTRYAYCDFLAWRILVEWGERRIEEWKALNSTRNKQ